MKLNITALILTVIKAHRMTATDISRKILTILKFCFIIFLYLYQHSVCCMFCYFTLVGGITVEFLI